jgi:hypothetical protein
MFSHFKISNQMLFIYSLFAILIFVFTAIFYVTNPVFAPPKIDISIPVQKQRLYKDVEFLTKQNEFRNYKNRHILDSCALYIQQQFEACQGLVKVQNYQLDNGNEYRNVICSFNTQYQERIVIGAHYDVCGNQAGADDNASAVAGMLEIARLIYELKPSIPYRIDLVAYSLEEPPFFRTAFMGSFVHASILKEEKAKIKMMFCLEMIGYFSQEKNSQTYPMSSMKMLYPNEANFIAIVGNMQNTSLVKKIKKSMKSVSKVPVCSINAPSFIQGIDYSDHRNYWHFNFPAVMITDTSFFRNPNYHQPTDTIETLDFDAMSEVIKGVYYAVTQL